MHEQWWKVPLILTFPAWGAVLIIFLASILPQSNAIQGPLTFLGGIGVLLSATPIFELKNTPLILKIIMALVYYFVSAIIIFVCGWVAYCWFYPSCH